MLEGVVRGSCLDRLKGWTALRADLTDTLDINLGNTWDSNKSRSFTKNPFFFFSLVLYTSALDIVGILLFPGKADDKSCVITLALIRNGHALPGIATEAVDWE